MWPSFIPAACPTLIVGGMNHLQNARGLTAKSKGTAEERARKCDPRRGEQTVNVVGNSPGGKRVGGTEEQKKKKLSVIKPKNGVKKAGRPINCHTGALGPEFADRGGQKGRGNFPCQILDSQGTWRLAPGHFRC